MRVAMDGGGYGWTQLYMQVFIDGGSYVWRFVCVFVVMDGGTCGFCCRWLLVKSVAGASGYGYKEWLKMQVFMDVSGCKWRWL